MPVENVGAGADWIPSKDKETNEGDIRMKLKFATVVLSAFVVSSCIAEEVRAPVNIAMELYKSCVVAFLQNEPYPNTAETIDRRLTELNSMCVDWAVIWLPAMLGQQKYVLSDAAYHRFDDRRISFLEGVTTELVLMKR